jgi:hypothetical protein
MLADRMKFPGLLPREIIILKSWLTQHETEWTRFAFNLRIGSGMDPGLSWGEDVRRGAILNSMKRIDAAAFNGPPEWAARFDAWQQTPPSVLASDAPDGNTAALPIVNLALYVPDGWTDAAIIEVKDRADYRAVGQLLGYRALWRQDHPTTTDPTLILVTNRVIPDLLPTINETGVQLAVVDADFTPLKRRS